MTEHISERSGAPSILRQDAILEAADLMESYLGSFREAVWRGNIEAAGHYWKATRECGKFVSTTFDELVEGVKHGERGERK
jgi:hypothetical protein